MVRVSAVMYASMMYGRFHLGSRPEAKGTTWARVQVLTVFLPLALSCRGRGYRGGVRRSPCFGGPEGTAERVTIQETQDLQLLVLPSHAVSGAAVGADGGTVVTGVGMRMHAWPL